MSMIWLAQNIQLDSISFLSYFIAIFCGSNLIDMLCVIDIKMPVEEVDFEFD